MVITIMGAWGEDNVRYHPCTHAAVLRICRAIVYRSGPPRESTRAESEAPLADRPFANLGASILGLGSRFPAPVKVKVKVKVHVKGLQTRSSCARLGDLCVVFPGFSSSSHCTLAFVCCLAEGLLPIPLNIVLRIIVGQI